MNKKNKLSNNYKKEIAKICIDANIDKLSLVLQNINDDKKKQIIENMFYKHMWEIADFILNSNFWKTGKLSEDFIKILHSKSYPSNYRMKKKTSSGKEIVYMIPGEYKIFNNFPWVDTSLVQKEMKKLIENYNSKINKIRQEDKMDFILKWILEFWKIHPFGNGNGMIGSILLDLMLLKNNLKPIGFKKYCMNIKIKQQLYNSIRQSIIYNDYYIFIDTLKKVAKYK